jgi:hypothetical protein
VSTGVKFFLGSAVFAGLVALAYWFASYEPAGTVLLGFMMGAMLFVSAYVVRSMRTTRLPGDRSDIRPEEVAGLRIGAFPTSSAYPIVIAGGIALFVGGLVYGWWMALPGLLLVAAGTIGLMRESLR